MNKEKVKVRIIISKKSAVYDLKNGATLKDIDREIFDWLAKIFEGKIIRNYKAGENKSEIIAELTLNEGVEKIIIKIEKEKKNLNYVLENKKILKHLFNEPNKKEATQEMIPNLIKNIKEINLPTRAYNCLISRNILFIYQLVQCSECEILKTKNLYGKTFYQIKDRLEELELELGMEISPEILEIIEKNSKEKLIR